MEQILLTPEEISDAKVGHVAILVRGKPEVYSFDRAVAKAQLKKVKGKIAIFGSLVDNIDDKLYIALAMLKEDWETLLKELEE